MAEKAGILERSISNYECDKSDPSIPNWQALAHAGIDVPFVLGIPSSPECLEQAVSILNSREENLRDEILKQKNQLLERVRKLLEKTNQLLEQLQ